LYCAKYNENGVKGQIVFFSCIERLEFFGKLFVVGDLFWIFRKLSDRFNVNKTSKNQELSDEGSERIIKEMVAY